MIKLAVIAMIINADNDENVEKINRILHESRHIVIGRMGLPYPKRKLAMISIMVEGKEDEINSLSGKLGMVDEVSVKTAYSNVSFEE